MAGEEQGRSGSIHHMNDVRWMQGGRWGPTAKATHWIMRSSALLQFWTSDISMIETARLDR